LKGDAAAEVRKRYAKANQRLIFLDYDGTLVPFADEPRAAVPDKKLLAILGALADDSANEVYLISGRDRSTLTHWFEGVGLNFVAEHGAWLRQRNAEWRLLKPLSSEWKERLVPILKTYADHLAGALLEEKEYSLAFHYRRCDPELGAQRAKQLIHELTQFTANFNVQVLEGKKVVEVRNAGVTKGFAAAQIASEVRPDFILAMGDDETDEDLFRSLPQGAVSIRVGTPFSHAQFSLGGHREVRALLVSLIESGRGSSNVDVSRDS
jgi:trehalose 6-phosphate synthase/phosphatase